MPTSPLPREGTLVLELVLAFSYRGEDPYLTEVAVITDDSCPNLALSGQDLLHLDLALSEALPDLNSLIEVSR